MFLIKPLIYHLKKNWCIPIVIYELHLKAGSFMKKVTTFPIKGGMDFIPKPICQKWIDIPVNWYSLVFLELYYSTP